MRYFYEIFIAGFIAILSSVFMLSKVSAEELKLATGEYPPFTSNQILNGGVVSEIVKLVFSKMDYDLAVDYLPWKRGYVLTKQNKYVATYPYLKTEERTKEFFYSDAIVEWKSKVYVRGDSKIVFNKMLDLKGLTECIPYHYGSLSELEEMHSAGEIKRIRPPHIKSCWLMILNGRADFFVEDIFVADIFRKEVLGERSDEIIGLRKPISTDYGYIIFPRQSHRSEELLNQFNQVFGELVNGGQIVNLRDDFLTRNTELVRSME
ncbi:MAG: transporter substrate-binding domain-containing protein [Halopseudomonas aestusnigri]